MGLINRDVERMYSALISQGRYKDFLADGNTGCDGYYLRHDSGEYYTEFGFFDLAECRRSVDNFFGDKLKDDVKTCLVVSMNRGSKIETKDDAGVPRFFYNF